MTQTITINFLPLFASVFTMDFTILAYFFYTLTIQIEALNFFQSNYISLMQEISRLQAENFLLKEELVFIKKSHLDLPPSKVISEVANQPISDEYRMFIIKVIIFVVAIVLISTVICLLSTQMYSWITQSFIGQLIAGTNALGLKAAEFMWLAKLKILSFLIAWVTSTMS
jgi:hypothetical protein